MTEASSKLLVSQSQLCNAFWIFYIVTATLLSIAGFSGPSTAREYESIIAQPKTNPFEIGEYSQPIHPIELLIRKQRKHFEDLQARQSKTLEEATAEYRRRYGRSPPLGFDYWFDLAQKHNFVLIDEFDTLTQSLEPFHGVPIDILRQRTNDILAMNDDRIAILNITNGNATMSDKLFFTRDSLPYDEWLEHIPYNMTALLNSFDEAMVTAPWENVENALTQAASHDVCISHGASNTTLLIDKDGRDGWNMTQHACRPESASRNIQCAKDAHDAPPPFIENAASSKDICEHCQLQSQHGLLVAPETLRISRDLVPIWSASKPSHFNDILIPSPYYAAVRRDYKPDLDIDWELKNDQFYWAGTATGGHVTDYSWDKMQRQRLVLQTSINKAHPIRLLEVSRNGQWTTRTSTMTEVMNLFDTKITKIVQCDEAACIRSHEIFGVYEGKFLDNQAKAYAYKFVFDIDGNAFSGRFLRLLQSKSVVVKHTIFREWHDDRLIPWVHYVPLSTGFEDLPEMARFLANSTRGLELSKVIAEESADWYHSALRDVDLRIATLRMLLEYGRLMNPEC